MDFLSKTIKRGETSIRDLRVLSIIFEKGSSLNAKEVLNFMQSLTNEKKVIKSLMEFHIDVSTCTSKLANY